MTTSRYKGKAQLFREKEVPEWVTWFPEGTAELEGEISYEVTPKSWEMAQANIRRRGLEIVVDYEHQTENSGENGQPAPAAGWCKEWRYVTNIGIQARVEWTPKAAEYLKSGEYRYFSPVFDVVKEGNQLILCKIHSIALTNNPKTNNIKAIAAKMTAGGQQMDIKALIALLGMAETATPEEVMQEVTALKEKSVELAKLLGLPPESSYEDIMTAVKGMVGGGEDSPEMAAMKKEQTCAAKMKAALGLPENAGENACVLAIKAKLGSTSELQALQAKVVALETAANKANADNLMRTYSAKFTPAMLADKEANWADLAESDPETFKRIVASLPNAVPSPLPPHQDKAAKYVPAPEHVQVASLLGVSAADLEKYNK